MRRRKLALPLLVAIACLVAGLVGTSAAAASQDAKQPGSQGRKLRIESVKVAGKAGPLALRVGAGVRSTVTIEVNGRPVGHRFQFSGAHTQSIELRTADGLRPGRNRLRITAKRDGVTSRANRTVNLPAWALRADAGEDTGAIVGTRTQVGSEPPPSSDAGADVDYSWRLLERPSGARARLLDRDDAEPVLHASEPGSYVLQETVDPESGEEPTSYDQVTVSVVPPDPPLGAPLNTLDDANKIVVGDESFGGGDGISYVVLERTTRYPVAADTVARNGEGIAKLVKLAEQYGSGDNEMRFLMIVSAPRAVPEDQFGALAGFLKKIGAALPSLENVRSMRLGVPFSVIGIPGAIAGAATVKLPLPGQSGAIVGYLTKNEAVDRSGTPVYDYNAGLQPTFDTKAAGSGGSTNTMVIGDQTYSAALPNGATAGLHLVVLDSFNLRPVANLALATNGGAEGDKVAQSKTAESLARTLGSGDPMVFLQTIGKPKAAGPEWQKVVNALARLGVNSIAVNALDGTNEYALAGRVGAKSPPAESSTAGDAGRWGKPTYPPAHLVGTLTRGRSYSYVPNVFGTATVAEPEGGVNLEMMSLAYQAPTPWPDLAKLPKVGSPAEAAAAAKFICEKLNFCQERNSCPSVRECFWQRYEAAWDLKYSKLSSEEGIKFPADGRFDEDTFKAVRKELADEAEAVANVKDYLEKLERPFETSQTESYVNLNEISDKIWKSLQRDAPGETTSFVLGLIGKIASFGGIVQKTRGAAAGLSALFGLVSYLSKPDGQPLLGTEVKARTNELAGQMLERIKAAGKATEGIGKLFVSDYAKLMTAYKKIDSDWALPTRTEAVNTLQTATKQWFWEALLPAGYPYLIRATDSNNARNLNCYILDKWAWPNQPDEYQTNATVGYRADGSPINAVFFFTQGLGGAMSPPTQIGDEMFKPRNQGGLGMEKYQFFTPRVFGQVYHAIKDTPACSVGFLPQGW